MNRQAKIKIETVILIAVISIAVFAVTKRLTPMQITLPEGHRAYEWEMTLKATGDYRVPIYKTVGDVANEIEAAVQQEIQKHLSEEVDEKGNPINIMEVSDIFEVDFKVRLYRDWEYIEEWTGKVKTSFHGYFTEGSISVAVVLLLIKVAPWILAGIIAIIVLDKIVKVAEVIRDITTDYVEEEEYLVDEEGNLVLDDEGNPIVIGRRTYRRSRIEQIMPWIFAIVAAVAVTVFIWKKRGES